jgi:hypothetical protein
MTRKGILAVGCQLLLPLPDAALADPQVPFDLGHALAGRFYQPQRLKLELAAVRPSPSSFPSEIIIPQR